MIPSISAPSMSGGGIDAIESRVQQIESLIQSVEARKAAALKASTSGLPVNPLSETEGPQPFQFYLKQTAQPTAILEGNAGKVPAPSSRFQAAQPLVENLSSRYGVDKSLVNAIIQLALTQARYPSPAQWD
jgi:soluble lytic murein transglycosylase-like protein